MSDFWRMLPFSFLVCLCGGIAHAQSGRYSQLISEIEAAAEQFDPDRIPDPEPLKQKVLTDVQALVEFFDRGTTPSNRDLWMQYFDLQPLIDAIEEKKSSAVLGREAQALSQRLVGFHNGLELEVVRKLRSSLAELIPALQYYKNRDRLKPLIAKRLSSLSEAYQDIQNVPSVEDIAATNELLIILNRTNQDLPMMRSLYSMFHHPNVLLWVSEPTIQGLVQQKVDRCQPVQDCILGAAIRGTACLSGSVHTDLVPADGRVRLRVSMSGQLNSRNVGYKKPVQIYTTASSGVCASRYVNVYENAIQMEPVVADATLVSKIHSVQHRFRIVRRIGWRKAHESKPQADAIAQYKTRNRIHAQFDEATRKFVDKPIPDVMQQARPYLQRLDFDEPLRTLSSTETDVTLRTIVRRPDQMSAPNPAPPVGGGYEFAMQIHESIVDNTLGRFLGSRKMTEEDIAQMMKKVEQRRGKSQPSATASSSSSAGDDESEDQKDDDLEITFAPTRPIVFEARDNELRFGLRAKFAQGKRKPLSLQLSATYQPAIVDGITMLMRAGELDVKFLGRVSKTMQAGMRNTIREKLANAFPTFLLDQPIMIPTDSKMEAFRGRTYRIRSIAANDGWLTIKF